MLRLGSAYDLSIDGPIIVIRTKVILYSGWERQINKGLVLSKSSSRPHRHSPFFFVLVEVGRWPNSISSSFEPEPRQSFDSSKLVVSSYALSSVILCPGERRDQNSLIENPRRPGRLSTYIVVLSQPRCPGFWICCSRLFVLSLLFRL